MHCDFEEKTKRWINLSFSLTKDIRNRQRIQKEGDFEVVNLDLFNTSGSL